MQQHQQNHSHAINKLQHYNVSTAAIRKQKPTTAEMSKIKLRYNEQEQIPGTTTVATLVIGMQTLEILMQLKFNATSTSRHP